MMMVMMMMMMMIFLFPPAFVAWMQQGRSIAPASFPETCRRLALR
jgi:hypothetical protein